MHTGTVQVQYTYTIHDTHRHAHTHIHACTHTHTHTLSFTHSLTTGEMKWRTDTVILWMKHSFAVFSHQQQQHCLAPPLAPLLFSQEVKHEVSLWPWHNLQPLESSPSQRPTCPLRPLHNPSLLLSLLPMSQLFLNWVSVTLFNPSIVLLAELARLTPNKAAYPFLPGTCSCLALDPKQSHLTFLLVSETVGQFDPKQSHLTLSPCIGNCWPVWPQSLWILSATVWNCWPVWPQSHFTLAPSVPVSGTSLTPNKAT